MTYSEKHICLLVARRLNCVPVMGAITGVVRTWPAPDAISAPCRG